MIDRRRMLLASHALVYAAAIAAGPFSHSQALAADGPPIELAGRTMGTTYHLKYWGDGKATPVDVHRKVEELLARFDKQMSTYREDSEASRFKRAAAKTCFPVSKETAYVVAKAIEYARLTDGALDVTVAPVLRLWNIGPGYRKDRLAPTDVEIAAAMKLVGAERLKVRLDPPALWKDADGVEVELSAIAPGYAVDLVSELLASLGFGNSMVEIGGEVFGRGARPDGSPWRVGVERAGQPDAEFVRIVGLRGLALTTAGDYRNVHGGGSAKYTHIVDPRTGRPLPFRGVSVTVLAESCLEADALDTALLVMGADAGYKWCIEHKVAALFQTGPDGHDVRTTPRFDDLTKRQASAASSRELLGP
jgi:thiamine biosynthesis lipoprotein